MPCAENDYGKVHRPNGFACLTDEKVRRQSQPSLPEKRGLATQRRQAASGERVTRAANRRKTAKTTQVPAIRFPSGPSRRSGG